MSGKLTQTPSSISHLGLHSQEPLIFFSKETHSYCFFFINNPCKFIMHLVCIRFCKLCELKQSPSSDCMIVPSQWHDAHIGQARHVTGTSKIIFCTRYIKSDICHIGYFVPSTLRKILFHLLHCTTSLSGTVA